MCVYIYIPWSSLDKIFLGVSTSFQKNMSSFGGGAYIYQISWVPPWHLQANMFPFTHAYWWQNHIAFVWIFRFLVSPSSKKLKNTFPDWKTTRITTFLVLRAFVCVFAGICGVFAGVLRGVILVAKYIFQWFLWFLRIITLSESIGCHKAPRCSAEQILICLMHLYFPSANGSNW